MAFPCCGVDLFILLQTSLLTVGALGSDCELCEWDILIGRFSFRAYGYEVGRQ